MTNLKAANLSSVTQFPSLSLPSIQFPPFLSSPGGWSSC